MDMAKIKLTQLAQHGDLLDRYGASIRVLGQRNLVKQDVLEAIDRAVEMTSRNGKAVLNVCFPYTSREEITTAIRSTVEEYSRPVDQSAKEQARRSPFREERIAHTIRAQHLAIVQDPACLQALSSDRSTSSSTTSLSSISNMDSTYDPSISSSTTTAPPESASPPSFDTKPSTVPAPTKPPVYPSPELITPQVLTEHMFTAADPPLDLLIRTSGVERLSDFMLWQCHQDTQIVFLKVLWPDFDLWSFLPVLWEWQWRTQKQQEQEADAVQRLRRPKGRSRAGHAK